MSEAEERPAPDLQVVESRPAEDLQAASRKEGRRASAVQAVSNC